LHSFVHTPFYLCQFCGIWTYGVKVMDFFQLKFLIELSFIIEKNINFRLEVQMPQNKAFAFFGCLELSIPTRMQPLIVWCESY